MANVGTVKSIHPRVRLRGDIGDRVRKERAAVVGEQEREHFKRPLAVGLDAAVYAAAVFGPAVSMGPFSFRTVSATRRRSSPHPRCPAPFDPCQRQSKLFPDYGGLEHGGRTTMNIEQLSTNELVRSSDRRDLAEMVVAAGSQKAPPPTRVGDWPLSKVVFVALVGVGYVCAAFAFYFMFNQIGQR